MADAQTAADEAKAQEAVAVSTAAEAAAAAAANVAAMDASMDAAFARLGSKFDDWDNDQLRR